MAYNLYLAKSYPFNDGFEKINLDEWNALIENNESLTTTNYIEIINPETKEKISMNLENAALFKNNNTEFILRWKNGYLVTECRNKERLNYLKELADKFGFKLYGEEGEEY